MNETLQLLERVTQLNVFERAGIRAPHKPLLLLFALGRVQRAEDRLVGYREVDRCVGELLREFGPARRTSASYPFWHLQTDDLWRVAEASDVPMKRGGNTPTVRWLKEHDTSGGFPPDLQVLLEDDEALRRQVAALVLHEYFPTTIHEELLEAVGLPAEWSTEGIALPQGLPLRKRRPGFRKEVLAAYDHRCAVCGFDVQLAGHPFGLDAAHVMWHQANGPDEVTNGLALCALHHRALDRGVIGLDEKLLLRVAPQTSGTSGLTEAFMAHVGKPLRRPLSALHVLDESHVAWHRREVFRSASKSAG